MRCPVSTADKTSIPFDPNIYNAKQIDFIQERTKSLLVEWGEQQLAGFHLDPPYEQTLYWNFARSKGWLKKAADELTTKGFGVAAAFLRR
jgi:hypothetical protein